MSLHDPPAKNQLDGKKKSWSDEPLESTETKFDMAMDFVKPRRILLMETHNFSHNTIGWRSYLQAERLVRCLEVLKEAELEDGTMYTHVIRTRPDLYWYGDHFDLSLLSTSNASFWHPAGLPWGNLQFSFLDWHFVVSRSELDILRVNIPPNSPQHEGELMSRGLEYVLYHVAVEKAKLPGHSWEREWPFPHVLVRTFRDSESASFICNCAATWARKAVKMGKLPSDTPLGLAICDLAYPRPFAAEDCSDVPSGPMCPTSCLKEKVVRLQSALKSQLGTYPVRATECPDLCLKQQIGDLRAAMRIGTEISHDSSTVQPPVTRNEVPGAIDTNNVTCAQQLAPRVAFVLVGRTNNISPLLFHSHVVAGFQAGPTSALFLALKAYNRNNTWYTSAQLHQLQREVMTLRPAAYRLWWKLDEPLERYCDTAKRLCQNCVWSSCTKQQNVIIAGFWGTLQVAFGMIREDEHKRHQSYDMVLFARADIVYSAHLDPYCAFKNTERYIYTSIDPPDAFMVLSRKHAEMLGTLESFETILNETSSCNSILRPTGIRDGSGMSFFLPCLWVWRHWTEGLRLISIPSLRGVVYGNPAKAGGPVVHSLHSNVLTIFPGLLPGTKRPNHQLMDCYPAPEIPASAGSRPPPSKNRGFSRLLMGSAALNSTATDHQNNDKITIYD